MKRSARNPGWSASVTLALFSIAVVLQGAPEQTAVGRPTGRVNGGVMDSQGKPLAEAFVTLSTEAPGLRASVVTPKNGTFGVDLPVGAYRVTAELRGYATSEPKSVLVKAGEKAAVKFALQPARTEMALESQISGAELLTQLPADARRTMIHRCASCHSLGVLGGKRLSPEGWAKIVERMAHKEPPGRGEADTLAPWEQNPWSGATAVLAKQFAPGKEPYRYEPFPIQNDLDHLAKVVVKEYRLKRPETNVHDIAVELSGKRIWYDDQESGEAVKIGLFGWYDPATGESKEYQVPNCPGFGGRILADNVGRIWAGCSKALAYWSPDTDKLTIFPMDKYGMRELWAIDSNGDAYTILRGRNVDPNGDPKYSFIGKFHTQTQEWTLFKVPTPWGNPYEVIPDSKDNIWFTEIATDKIGKLDPRTGQFTEYDIPTKGGNPRRFAIDSKDNVWFTEYSGNKIGMVDSRTGQVAEYEVPTPNSIPYACGVDKNGTVWFSEIAAMRLGRFDPKTKSFREYPVPYKLSSVKNINFTYAKDKQFIWGSDRTGPNIIGVEIPMP